MLTKKTVIDIERHSYCEQETLIIKFGDRRYSYQKNEHDAWIPDEECEHSLTLPSRVDVLSIVSKLIGWIND